MNSYISHAISQRTFEHKPFLPFWKSMLFVQDLQTSPTFFYDEGSMNTKRIMHN